MLKAAKSATVLMNVSAFEVADLLVCTMAGYNELMLP
jgi:hypothetical protein